MKISERLKNRLSHFCNAPMRILQCGLHMKFERSVAVRKDEVPGSRRLRYPTNRISDTPNLRVLPPATALSLRVLTQAYDACLSSQETRQWIQGQRRNWS